MATVTSQLTRIHDVEGALTLTSIGGGAGGAANAEIFIQGAQSAGRKQSNAADHGFWLTVASRDVSPAGTHVGVWINHIHYAVLTLLRVRLGSTIGSLTAGAWDGHNVPLTEYPATGGWIRAWFDVDRTPEATGDSGALVQTALIGVAVVASLPAVGGNAPNLIMDASDFTTGGLLLTGTSGVFQDFVTADEGNGTNKYGIVVTKAGIIYCLARLTLGSASSLAFSDSGFVIVFPQQATVAASFMGINVDLQNALTAITWANGVLKSAGSVKGDLVVTGTSGAFTVTGTAFSAMRLVTLTSVCSITGSSFDNCGVITAPGSTLTNTTVSGYAGTADTSSLVWDVATDPDGKLNGMTFTKGSSSAHAIEFGTTSLTTMTLRNVTFTGFNAANGATDSTLHIKRTTGTVTINVVGGTAPSYKTDGGTVDVVVNPVTTTVTTKDIDGDAVGSVNVYLKAASGGAGVLPVGATISSITRVTTTATATHAAVHNLKVSDKIHIKGADQAVYNGVFTILTVPTTTTYTYTIASDPGADSSNAGITGTFVFLKDITNATTGILSMSRVITADQNVIGWARKSSGTPFYKTAPISGTVLSASGLSVTAVMILDE